MSSSTDAQKGKEGCLAFILFLIAIPLGAIWQGFVISKTWEWFILPTFHVPPLSVISSIGLSIFASTLQSVPRPKKSTEEPLDVMLGAVNWMAFKPGWILFTGWIASHWMK